MNIFPSFEPDNNSLNLDEIFGRSLDMNNLIRAETSSKAVQKYFSKSLKMRNASRRQCWSSSTNSSNVSE